MLHASPRIFQGWAIILGAWSDLISLAETHLPACWSLQPDYLSFSNVLLILPNAQSILLVFRDANQVFEPASGHTCFICSVPWRHRRIGMPYEQNVQNSISSCYAGVRYSRESSSRLPSEHRVSRIAGPGWNKDEEGLSDLPCSNGMVL